MIKLNEYIDHTLLKPDAKKEDIEKLCEEAVLHSFFSVCINPYNIPFAVPCLENTGIKICTVIGFPLGADLPGIKATEAKDAILLGASELDMVLNIGALIDGDYDLVNQEILSLVHVVKASGAKSKIILETGLLTDEKIVAGCRIAMSAGADFVKTSTGFSSGGGATVHAVSLMKHTVGNEMGIKASGGIRDKKTAFQMIDAGATRLGTSSSVEIVTE